MTLHDAQSLVEPLYVFHIFFNWHGYYYMLGTALNTFPASTHSVLIAPLWSSCNYCLHFTIRKTAQKNCHLSKIIELVGGRARIWTRQSPHYLFSLLWERSSSSLMACQPRFCPTQARTSSSAMSQPFPGFPLTFVFLVFMIPLSSASLCQVPSFWFLR